MAKAGVVPNHTNPHPDFMKRRDRPMADSRLRERLAEERKPKSRSGRMPAGHGQRRLDADVLALAKDAGVVGHPHRNEEVLKAHNQYVVDEPVFATVVDTVVDAQEPVPVKVPSEWKTAVVSEARTKRSKRGDVNDVFRF